VNSVLNHTQCIRMTQDGGVLLNVEVRSMIWDERIAIVLTSSVARNYLLLKNSALTMERPHPARVESVWRLQRSQLIFAKWF
jgi:hypothetical protein